jgi:multidrug resistance efflux pump
MERQRAAIAARAHAASNREAERQAEPSPSEFEFEFEVTQIGGWSELPQAGEWAEPAQARSTPDDSARPPPDEARPNDGARPSDEARPNPDAIAEQEQAELWRAKQNRPWHKRAWVRALLVVTAVTGVAAIIPYPLRITSECTLIATERAKVRSELKGVISEILVDEGRAVKKGDVIARLDDRALKAERLKVLAEIDKIEAELATLRQGHRREELQQQEAIVAARRNEVVFGAKEAKRRNQMAREGIGSRQAAEAASRELESRRRALDEARAALRLLQAGARPEEIAAHEAVLKRARAELAYVDERLAMTIVRAPIDGEILTPRFREHIHEGVEAGGLICEIANMRHMRAEIFTPERELDVIGLGMPVIVKVESYPMHPFEGKVDFIAPAVDGDGKRLRVVVDLDNATGMLKANMTGFAEVETGKHSLLDLATRRVLRWVRVRYLL